MSYNEKVVDRDQIATGALSQKSLYPANGSTKKPLENSAFFGNWTSGVLICLNTGDAAACDCGGVRRS